MIVLDVSSFADTFIPYPVRHRATDRWERTMNKLIWTAAVLAIAAPVAAQDMRAVCNIAGSIGYEAAAMRQSGMSQRGAANVLASRIGAAASNGPGSQADRQYLASLIGGASTHILRVVYSVPVYRTAADREFATVAAGQFFFEACMNGDL